MSSPLVCTHCQQPLEGVAGQIKERQQVQDLPEGRLVVREHQVEEVCCPVCQQVSRGSFPAEVEAPVQYGPNLRALAVSLHEYQLVPLGRVSELLADLYACQLSEGTRLSWCEVAAARLAPTVAQIADRLSAGRFQYADETGVRIGGRPWRTLASGRAFEGGPCAIGGPATISIGVRRASVERICCVSVSTSANKNSGSGRLRWLICWLAWHKQPTNGDNEAHLRPC